MKTKDAAKIHVYPTSAQGRGAFDGGRITENKPIGFSGEGSACTRTRASRSSPTCSRERSIPALDYHELDRCGHYPWLERHVRERFFSLLEEILRSEGVPGREPSKSP